MLKRLWVTGYRAYELNVHGQKDPHIPVIKDSLRNVLLEALDDGLEWIITGGQQGVEQWAAEVGMELKADYPNLQVAIMLPYLNFGNRWQEESQSQLAALRERVDFSASISNQPYQSGYQLAQYGQFMTAHTDGALFVYDPEFPGKTEFDYKRATNLPAARNYDVRTITMDDLEEVARTLAENEAEKHFE
ncbi:DUF1273 domain-containing protein [Lacticaseibacillus hulanensis]|uniref:DUF1273 domain-containing protein n=1 Tax=Lacticaseibacillus hulanensis TaxID=2493111 RepID=UPI001F4DAFE0|nr:DUF1273 domain-containing protein [Lacticaseibacillus hulanensis]